jgi:DNA-directed RNA polymerase sigma subunit (sigma70/sigma32)
MPRQHREDYEQAQAELRDAMSTLDALKAKLDVVASRVPVTYGDTVSLSPREYTVLMLRFAVDKPISREALAKLFDVSPERIKQNEYAVHRKMLRHALNHLNGWSRIRRTPEVIPGDVMK